LSAGFTRLRGAATQRMPLTPRTVLQMGFSGYTFTH